MEDDSTVVATYIFRGIEYVVTMNVASGNELVVEVEDRLTADQWRGHFDAAYLEDLTHKTGNYKQFPIFVSMLESALTQSSDSVSLDLLTYSDLESLRNRKTGTTSKNIPPARTGTLNSKRYLILTYTVEFDRIHYPLPLPYMGKPDPRALQETIRQLRQQVKTMKGQSAKDMKSREIDKLRRQCEKLLLEKEEIEAEFVEFKRQLNTTTEGVAVKEIKVLKSVIKNLEEDLVKQKTRNQRSTSKRSQEHRQLMNEVDELRASERNLRVRVKSLTNELALYKRRKPNNSTSARRDMSTTSSRLRDRSSSRERSYNKDYSYGSARSRSRDSNSNFNNSRNDSSRENSYVKDNSRTSSRSYTTRHSFENLSLPGDRSRSRERVTSRSRPRSNSAGSYTPAGSSPSGARVPRFDPTAFVKEKERRKKEAALKKKRQARSSRNGSFENRRGSLERKTNSAQSSPAYSDRYNGRARQHSRASSTGSLRSRASSVESLSDAAIASDSSEARIRRLNKVLKPGKTSSSSAWINPGVHYKKPPAPKKILSSTPDRVPTRAPLRQKENIPSSDGVDSDYFDRSAEISEIDARLNRLQEFMKSNLT